MKLKIVAALAVGLCMGHLVPAQDVTVKVKDNFKSYYFPSKLSYSNRLTNNLYDEEAVLPNDKGLLRLKAGKSPYYKFSYITLYIEPGQTLEMDLDQIRHREDIKFSGPQAAANHWMMQKLVSTNIPFFPDIPVNTISYATFRDTVFRNLAAVKAELPAIKASRLFKDDARLRVNFQAISSLLKYYDFNVVTAKQRLSFSINDSTSLQEKERLMAGFETWKFNYYKQLHDSIMADVARLLPKLYEDRYNDFPETVRTLYSLQHFDSAFVAQKNLAGFNELSAMIENSIDQDFVFHTNFKQLAQRYTDSSLKRYIGILDERYKPLQPGNKAKDWEMEDEDGNKVMLSSLTNKPVYLDFWATWCMPCLAMKPDFEKLADQYAAKNINFVAISVDEKKEKWQSFLQKHPKNPNIKYYHISDPAFRDQYQMSTIPRFIMLDTSFNIIDARAPKPVETERIVSLLNKLSS